MIVIFDGGSFARSTRWHDSDELYCAGSFQKTIPLMEGVLESLPEVIMQSVFIIRSYNDDRLMELEEESGVSKLIAVSIIASLLSCNC